MKYTTLLFSILFLYQCADSPTSGPDPSLGITRPMQPWVFRSVLDLQPRMITLALHQELYAAYSTQDCALYKTWKGGVELDGAVYTTHHGPQPTSLGDDYFVNKYRQPWKINIDNKEITPKVQYLGHRFKNKEVILMYALSHESITINVEEKPTFSLSTVGFNKFTREFVHNAPEGVTVSIDLNFNSLMSDSSIKTDGQWTPMESSKGIEGTLTLNPRTKITAYLSSPTIINKAPVSSEPIDPGLAVIQANDCQSCHNEKLMTVGPSYTAIANKYDNTIANKKMLMATVRNGSSGKWGSSVMTPHPEILDNDLNTMIEYIMNLDADEEAIKASLISQKKLDKKNLIQSDKSAKLEDLTAGLLVDVYKYEDDKESFFDIDISGSPEATDILDFVDMSGPDFGRLDEKFALDISGYLYIPNSEKVVLRIASDDGSILYLNDKKIIDNDGLHGTVAKDAQVALEEGLHTINLKFYENGGGQSLFFQWRTKDTGEFVTIPAENLFHLSNSDITKGKVFKGKDLNPGDQSPLAGVHPSFTLSQARPNNFEPKVGGLDFLSDGRAVVSTWDALGAVYIIDNVTVGDTSNMSVKRIASGLAEPLGVKVVDDVIYIMQKQEMTKLVDIDGDDLIDEYRVLSNDWEATANFHEFGFGLEESNGYLYATLATGILPGGASAPNQPKDRGSVIRVNISDGTTEKIANGLRTPNGVGVGVDGEIFVADNEGDWLPSCKILHITEGSWYGSRSVDFEGTAQLKEKKPVVWLPQNEIGNSPTTPTYIEEGPYAGQMLHGEVTHGGIKRVSVEKVDGAYQGCVFRFTQGMEAGVNRLRWNKADGSLYAGGIGSTGNWSQDRKLWYGLQKLTYNKKSTFEMLSISARSDGIMIEYTEPLAEGYGDQPDDYEISTWYYLPTENYGGPKMEEHQLTVLYAYISKDRKKVFLELKGMKDNHVVYVHANKNIKSTSGQSLWSTEGWYTMNAIPTNLPGELKTVDTGINTLSTQEKEEGWQLLFDGKTTNGWRNFNKRSVGIDWKVINGELTLVPEKINGVRKGKNGWDIISDLKYKNYELKLEWKVCRCGNSGIIYNVSEDKNWTEVWQTGPEMQVLDNSCHPDAKIKTHRAGDLYDMISCSEETVKPSGQWNQVLLRNVDGKVEHWLNGVKVVEFQMFDDKWKQMIAESKFKDMKGFGTYREGHIALQDHDDRISYRNIKIRPL